MSIIKEFKQFAVRGNAVDLAVAVVMGVAFGKIIASMVDGMVMPMIGLLLGGINIAAKTFTIGDAVIKWGAFLQSIIDFIIIALAIFAVVKIINLLKREEEKQPIPLTREEQLLTEIRDLLKGNMEAKNIS